MIAQTSSEGPGRRFALWLQGCVRRCPGCCNPEMWPTEGGTDWSVPELLRRITSTEAIEGLTVLGGEPFDQAEEAAELCRGALAAGLNVMVFTGYTFEEIQARRLLDAASGRLLEACDVLVDGPYRQDQPERRRRWVGSSNQRVHFLTSRFDQSDDRFDQPNSLELRLQDGVLTVNGWPALELAR